MNKSGYYRINGGTRRGQYLHRAVWEFVAGRELPEGWQVHHQDFDKKNCCPYNLIAMPREFNTSPSQSRRCPHTGQFLTADEYRERMGFTTDLTEVI